MTVAAHDFTRPLPLAPSLRAKLTQWLGRANALSAEQFVAMSVPIELRLDVCTTAFPSEALAEWSDKPSAFKVVLDGQDAASVVAVPNSLIQEVIGRMLGEQPEAVSAERDLTPAETSIGQFAVETLVKNLNESWLEEAPLNVRIEEVEPNLRRTRLFRPTEAFVECRTSVKTPLGASHWSWFLSMEFLTNVFGLPSRPQRPSKEHSRRSQLESLVRGMQSGIVVRLGTVQLSGPQLGGLRVGDLVVLDQRVGEPLRATVRGEPKFLGWAGRVGDRQAFEIESELQLSRRAAASLEPATSAAVGSSK